MYLELAKIFLSAVFFRATNIFGIKTAAVYLSLSLFLLFAKPEANMPASFLITTAFAFTLFVAEGIFRKMIKRKRPDHETSMQPCPKGPGLIGSVSSSPTGNSDLKDGVSTVVDGKNNNTRGGVPDALNIFLPIFSIGYVFTIFRMNIYVSIIAVFALYFLLRKYRIPTTAWGVAFAASIIHAIIFSKIASLLNPTIYAVVYIFIMRFFFAAKDAFSITCKPHELKEGMTPAEAIVWDGKRYVFTNSILPSMMGLVRYGMEQKVFGKRVVASFFSPLKKENISEIQKVCKQYKKPVFSVQKKTGFMPFLFAGALIVLLL